MTVTTNSCIAACGQVDQILDYCTLEYDDPVDCVCTTYGSNVNPLPYFEGCTVCQDDSIGEYFIRGYEAWGVICDTYSKAGPDAAESLYTKPVSTLDKQFSTSLLPQIDSQFGVNPATQTLTTGTVDQYSTAGYYTVNSLGGISYSTTATARTVLTSTTSAHTTSSAPATVRSRVQSITTTVSVPAVASTSASSSSSAGAARAKPIGHSMVYTRNDKLGLIFGATAAVIAAAAYAL